MPSCRGKWTVEELDPARRMLAAHRGSGTQHRVFLAPQLCAAVRTMLCSVRRSLGSSSRP